MERTRSEPCDLPRSGFLSLRGSRSIPLGKRIEVRGFFAPNIIPSHPDFSPSEKNFLSVFIRVHLWFINSARNLKTSDWTRTHWRFLSLRGGTKQTEKNFLSVFICVPNSARMETRPSFCPEVERTRSEYKTSVWPTSFKLPLGKRIEVRGFFAPNIIPPHPNLLPREKELISVSIRVHL